MTQDKHQLSDIDNDEFFSDLLQYREPVVDQQFVRAVSGNVRRLYWIRLCVIICCSLLSVVSALFISGGSLTGFFDSLFSLVTTPIQQEFVQLSTFVLLATVIGVSCWLIVDEL